MPDFLAESRSRWNECIRKYNPSLNTSSVKSKIPDPEDLFNEKIDKLNCLGVTNEQIYKHVPEYRIKAINSANLNIYKRLHELSLAFEDLGIIKYWWSDVSQTLAIHKQDIFVQI